MNRYQLNFVKVKENGIEIKNVVLFEDEILCCIVEKLHSGYILDYIQEVE